MSWLSNLLLRHLRQPPKKRQDKRAFASSVAMPELTATNRERFEEVHLESEEGERNKSAEQTNSKTIEIYPADSSARKPWFSLTIREREVAALVCMGYRNYEIATMLGVGYGTIQTYLQRIFDKFDLRSRKEVRGGFKKLAC